MLEISSGGIGRGVWFTCRKTVGLGDLEVRFSRISKDGRTSLEERASHLLSAAASAEVATPLSRRSRTAQSSNLPTNQEESRKVDKEKASKSL